MSPLNIIVREHRRMAGLSQAGLAKLAGVGKTVVFDLEHGKMSIRFDTLTKILGVLNISIRFESPAMQQLRGERTGEEAPSV